MLELFTPDRNLWWKVIPMGELNAASKFVEMKTKIKRNGTHRKRSLIWKIQHEK